MSDTCTALRSLTPSATLAPYSRSAALRGLRACVAVQVGQVWCSAGEDRGGQTKTSPQPSPNPHTGGKRGGSQTISTQSTRQPTRSHPNQQAPLPFREGDGGKVPPHPSPPSATAPSHVWIDKLSCNARQMSTIIVI